MLYLLLLLLCDVKGDGRCGGGVVMPLDFNVGKFGVDNCGRMEEAGVETP